VLAQAIKTIYPTSMLAIGPVTKTGFYYDIDFKTPISFEDIAKIEEEMKKIIKSDLPIERFTLSRKEAIKLMKNFGEPYKVQLIEDLPDGEEISFYKQGEFTDLCRGPHLPSTGKIKAFKLTQLNGSYWRGDSKNKMLTRIYGTSFYSKEELDSHLNMLEERKRRDHRLLGKQLSLFMISEFGPGFPFWLPSGMTLKNALVDFWTKQHIKYDYEFVDTPIILSKELWETSGHWYHYRDNMYTVDIDEKDFAVKPMNCPGSILVFKNAIHSYRDLPIRMAELGKVHRHECRAHQGNH
jgi:threonyl-tRNA synthetase